MAVYRQVHISFWQDTFVLSLTPEEKFFYIYLMTNSKTTQCGIYEIPEQIMVVETGYNLETINKLLSKFIKYGKIDYNKKNRELFLINWAKYNCSNSPKIKTRIETELKSVKTRDFIDKYLESSIEYGYSIDTETQREREEEREYNNNDKEIDSIVPVWNTFAKLLNLTQIMKLTPKRIASLKQRIKEPEFNLESIMQKIKMSDFLQGKNKQGWKVDFDFVFCSKNNYIKILEGKYDGTNNGNGGATIGGLTAIVNRRLEREQKGN
jgi:hypothetical protein